MTEHGVPDYEPAFAAAVADFWGVRSAQSQRQIESGNVDAGTRGAVTGGKHLDAVATLIGQVIADAGIDVPHKLKLPGFYRRDKNFDVVARYRESIAVVIELKSHIGSIGNNFNNRVEEMIGQSVDFWKAHREELLGPVAPWFGYFMLLEDSAVTRRQARPEQTARAFPADTVFTGTNYIDRYAIALDRLRFERDMDSVCLIASKSDGTYSYPNPTMTFQAFATSIHARGMTISSQLDEAGA